MTRKKIIWGARKTTLIKINKYTLVELAPLTSTTKFLFYYLSNNCYR
jgi:hypothetical protein